MKTTTKQYPNSYYKNLRRQLARRKTEKDKMQYLLDRTMNFYNKKNFAYNKSTNSCVYGPVNSSPGCAIGCYLPRNHNALTTQDAISVRGIDLPNNLRGISINFLGLLQNLHDDLDSDSNLFESRELDEIINTYNLKRPVRKVEKSLPAA